MPTQKNFQGSNPPLGSPYPRATVKSPQMNFKYGKDRPMRPGKSNKSSVPVQFKGKQGVPNATLPKSHFGEKSGTGNNGGY